MTEKLNFAVEDIRVLEEIDKSQFSLLAVDCFATGKSAHNTFITEETLRRTAESILLKPFVFAIDKRFNDLGTHTSDEVPGGFVPHNSPIEYHTLPDGRVMMSVHVLVWKRYSGKLLEYFRRDENRKGVSVEIEVFDARKDEKSGLLEILDFAYMCITALGDFIRPAIPNAQAVLQFSEEFEKAKEEYEFSRYEDIDFTIPKTIKRSAQKALDQHVKGGSGKSASLTLARFLVKNTHISPEKARSIHKFFLGKPTYDDPEIGLHGGRSAAKWAKGLVEKLDEIDSKPVSYFNVENHNDNSVSEEEINMAKKDKDKVEEQIEMSAAPEETAEQPNTEMSAPACDEKDEHEEEMSAEEKPEDSDKPQEEEMAADKKDEPESEEEKKDEGEEFSFDFDIELATSYLANSEDERCVLAAEELKKGKDASFAVLMNGMFAACQSLSESLKKATEATEAMSTQFAELQAFKSKIEADQKEFAVNTTLKDLCEKFAIPEEALNQMKADAANYSFADLEGWKTSVKAKAVDFAVIAKPNDDQEEIMRIGIPPREGGVRSTQRTLWVGK